MIHDSTIIVKKKKKREARQQLPTPVNPIDSEILFVLTQVADILKQALLQSKINTFSQIFQITIGA